MIYTQSIVSTARGFALQVATLPPVTFRRYLSRLVLYTSLTAADTNSNWDPEDYTSPAQVRIGTLDDASSIVDYTTLGDMNVAEYATPLLIPTSTALYVVWEDISSTDTKNGRCTANLVLSR